MEEKTMEINLVSAETSAQLAEIEKLYMEAFPEDERKPFSFITDQRANGRVEILAAQCTELQENAIVGEAILAEWNNVVLLDYFAVFSEFRSKGAGTNILKALQKRYHDKRFILEIESTEVPAENYEQRQNRKQFYKRNGMQSLGYSADVFGVEMEVLGYKCVVSFEEYQAVFVNVFGKKYGERVVKVE